MVKNIPADVRQELMIASVLAPHPVDVRQAMEALKAAPSVVKVVKQLPPKPHTAKPPPASVVAKQSSAAH